jgi:hypothetical protein
MEGLDIFQDKNNMKSNSSVELMLKIDLLEGARYSVYNNTHRIVCSVSTAPKFNSQKKEKPRE